MIFELIVSKGNPRIYKHRDLSILDVKDDRLKIIHPKYKREILYDEIMSIKKERGVKLTLKNLEILTFSFPYKAMGGIRGVQEVKNSVRRASNLYELISDKMSD